MMRLLRTNLQLEFKESGICHGFVLWIDWVVDSTTELSTGPGTFGCVYSGIATFLVIFFLIVVPLFFFFPSTKILRYDFLFLVYVS